MVTPWYSGIRNNIVRRRRDDGPKEGLQSSEQVESVSDILRQGQHLEGRRVDDDDAILQPSRSRHPLVEYSALANSPNELSSRLI